VPAPAVAPKASVSTALPPFRELYEKHFAFTWRSLRYLGVAEAQLDDAVQEVWVAAYRRLADFEGRSDLRTWLFSIAINVQRNLHRSERRHSAHVPLPTALISPAADPALEREGREAWMLVLGFLETLDGTRRAVFVASLLEGMAPAEAAEATGLDVTTIYHRVRSLRRSFRLWAAAARRGEP
jgi:RNA polymerase sigma-70 factor (ECF subfamily)